MPTFEYVVSDSGLRRTGVLEASGPEEAAEMLRRRALLVLSLSESAPAAGPTATAAWKPALLRWLGGLFVSKRGLEVALGQLAALLDAGVLAIDALAGVARQSPWLLRRALNRTAERIRSGSSFADALQSEAPWIGAIPVGLISVGEARGSLGAMLHQGADWMERRRSIRNRVMEALAYPAIVTVLALGVGYFLTTSVIPKIMEFITRNKGAAALPGSTQLLLDISAWINAYGLYVLGGICLLALALIAARRSPRTGPLVDRAALRLPLLGRVFASSANVIWCRTLGLLLASGINVIEALKLVQGVSANQYYQGEIARLRGKITRGSSISAAIKSTALARFCPLAGMMLGVGEGAGIADESLVKTAEYEEESLVRRVGLLARLIEPAVYVVIGGMVGLVYYSFFAAIQAMTQSIHG